MNKDIDLVKALRGELVDCNCCAYGSSECCCDTVWPEDVAREAADEIEFLRNEVDYLHTYVFKQQKLWHKQMLELAVYQAKEGRLGTSKEKNKNALPSLREPTHEGT